MKKHITIVVCFFLAYTIYGQDDSLKTNALQFEIGINHIQLKDRTFSPIVFTGKVPEVNIAYGQKRTNSLWNIGLSASFGSINHSSNFFESTFVSAEFIGNYLKRLKSNKKGQLYLGGQFRSELDVLDYFGFASGSWHSAQQLEPILIYDYTISDNQLIRGQFNYPIFSFVSRPNYAGIDEFLVVNSDNIPKILYSRMEFYSLNKLINPNFEIQYIYSLKRVNFSVTAAYSYLQVNSARKYQKNEVDFNIGIQIKIGKNNEV